MTSTLLAVTGLSPAIVTETVWALAQEEGSRLPNRVIFLTTLTGARQIQEELLTPRLAMGGQTAWQALREALNAGDDELIAEPPRLIGQINPIAGTVEPLADIITPEDNRIAAGFILEQVRGIVENPDSRLVASIAGGRKTMGALLHAAMTLLGRERDRLTHVLVSPPFDALPGFFFPGQPGGRLQAPDGRSLNPAAARVSLATVPFVPLRNRFEDLREMPGSFEGLVERFSRTIKDDAARPRLVEIGYRQKSVWVDDIPFRVPPKALAVLHFLLVCQQQGQIPIDQQDAADRMNGWLRAAGFIPAGLRPQSVDTDAIRHCLNDLRRALKASGWMIPSRSLSAPPFTLRLRDK